MIREQEQEQETGDESNFRERQGKFNLVTLDHVFGLLCVFFRPLSSSKSSPLIHMGSSSNQSSVPAVVRLLLRTAIALILIPVTSRMVLLLLRAVTPIAVHRSPGAGVWPGSFGHVSIVHLIRRTFHSFELLVRGWHGIHTEIVVARVHLIGWPTERSVLIVLL